MVTLLFFARLREAIGHESETIVLPSPDWTPNDVISHLCARGEPYAQAFADVSRLHCALDQEHAKLESPIGDAREIAFFPPVTGG